MHSEKGTQYTPELERSFSLDWFIAFTIKWTKWMVAPTQLTDCDFQL